MKRAIYAISADPLTNGHLNIIQRALNVFDEIIVGIGINPGKKYTFTLEERESLARQVLQPLGDKVIVKAFPGLLSDFAYENDIHTVIRGARNSADFDFERLLKDINQGFKQGVETLIYIADQDLSHVSSSAAKELTKNQAENLLDYVPIIVKRALERRISGQYFVGITGEIGCGKSYVANALCNYLNDTLIYDERFPGPVRAHEIDLDHIGHEVLESATEKIYVNTREEIAWRFGKNLLKANGKIDVPGLSKIIFKNPQDLLMFNIIMKNPMSLLLRRKLLSLKGIILINSALIAEEDISPMVNNDVIVVRASKKAQVRRLKERGYSNEVVYQRLSAQFPVARKVKILQESQEKYRHGKIIYCDNEGALDIEKLYQQFTSEIINYAVR
jgi:pantetheine-phosphate adenylyltransferase